MPSIGAIIPIYNCEKYLKQCLDSILNQTFEDFEVYLIEDCSTDNSKKIAKEYEKKDKRFKLFENKENKGATYCRNKGIDLVNSKYCIFLDSDDFFDCTMFEKCYKKLESTDVDIVLFEVNKYDNKTKKISLEYKQIVPENSIFNAQTYPKSLFNIVPSAPWDRMFKTDFVKNTPVRYLDVKLFDDISFVCLTMLLAEKITKISEPLIYYRVNVKNSKVSLCRSQKKGIDSKENLNNALRYIYDYALENIPYFEKIKHHILDFELAMYSHYLDECCLNKKEKEKYINYLCTIFASNKYDNLDENQFAKDKFAFLNKYKKLYFKNLKNRKLKLRFSSFCSMFLNTLKYFNEEYLDNFGLSLSKSCLGFMDKNVKTFKNFKKHKLKNGNNVLVVEADNHHGEIIPGTIKYFWDLGFNVDLLVTPAQEIDNSFTFDLNSKKINKFVCNFETITEILSTDKIKEYDCLFFTSQIIYSKVPNVDFYPSVFYFFNNIKPPKHGIYAIEHHLDHKNEEFIKYGTTFQLADLKAGHPEIKQLNTHYFGNVKITNKSKDITRFIVVGGLAKERRNCSLLTNAIKELVKMGYENFEVVVIGNGDVSYIPENIKKYIKILGRVDYPTMYKQMEKADFFLPLLDPKNPEHDRYITVGTSGSYQLIYGFKKPCLIHEKFTAFHALTPQNSLIYNTFDGLKDKMIEAINMNDKKYELLQNNLKILSDELYKKSLNNLKEALIKNGVENV